MVGDKEKGVTFSRVIRWWKSKRRGCLGDRVKKKGIKQFIALHSLYFPQKVSQEMFHFDLL